MFEMLVEDIFTITGLGTVFAGMIQAGSVSVGDPIVVKTRATEIKTRVAGLQEVRSGRRIEKAEAGAMVGVICMKIKDSQLQDAFEGEGDQRRIVGVTVVAGTHKPWWHF